MLGRLLIASAALLLGTAAAAQQPTAEPEDGGAICVSGPLWWPSSDDVQHIEAEPVPASFRSIFESTAACSRMALNERHLVNWHLAFGSERTLTAALDYIVADYLRDVPTPEAYRGALRSAWRRFERDVRRTAHLPPVERSRLIREGEGYERVTRVVDLDRQFGYLAEWALRGAEDFRSAALLAISERFLAPLVDGSRFLAERPAEETRRLGILFGYTGHRLDDFRMRAAILRARLSGGASDLQAAETLLTTLYRPIYLEAAQAASDEGLCEFEDEPAQTALRAACREDNFTAHVMNYWINRAMLDLLRDVAEPNDDLAFEILTRAERCCAYSRGHYREATDDQRRLLLARAERGIRRFEVALARDERHDAISDGFDALHDLQRAERMIPPFDRPRHFREVAQAWLRLHERIEGAYAIDDERPEGGVVAMRHRYAAYLRHLLSGLDAIRVGTGHGLPPRPN